MVSQSKNCELKQEPNDGLTPPSLLLCRPQGLLVKKKGKNNRNSGAFILRGAYATIAIIVSP